MLQSFLSSLRASASNDPVSSRRRYPRRAEDRCVVEIAGQTFPVENWSFGGLLINTDDRLFSAGQELDLVLKFKLRNKILDVPQHGRIIRKGNGKVAVQFDAMEKLMARPFQQVIDDLVAREFANSQI